MVPRCPLNGDACNTCTKHSIKYTCTCTCTVLTMSFHISGFWWCRTAFWKRLNIYVRTGQNYNNRIIILSTIWEHLLLDDTAWARLWSWLKGSKGLNVDHMIVMWPFVTFYSHWFWSPTLFKFTQWFSLSDSNNIVFPIKLSWKISE